MNGGDSKSRLLWLAALRGLCPEDEDWAGYASGAIEAGELRGAMEAHLEDCPGCRDACRDAQSFFGPATAAMGAGEVEAALLAVRAKATGVTRVAVKPAPPARFDWRWGAMAASVLLAAGQWYSLQSQRAQWAAERAGLERSIRQLSDDAESRGKLLALAREPAINSPIVDLRPAGAILRSGGGAAADARAVSAAQPLTLILNGARGRRVRLELEGPETLALDGSYDGDGVLAAAIPAGRLAPGTYSLTLVDGGQRQPLAPGLTVLAR